MAGARIAAVDMGGTKIKACLFEDGLCVERAETDSEARQGGGRLLSNAAGVLRGFGAFDALGVSTAGQVDPAWGTIRYANDNIKGYTGMDVKGWFTECFARPVAVLNDVYAAALGEGTHGAARGERDYICLTYGTGIGGGVVLDGALYYGAGASAGVMLGGILTHPEQVVPGDAFSGTYERYASTTALMAAAQAADPALTSGRALFTRLDEPLVKGVVDRWLDEVAAGICTLVHAFNVPCVVLGGGVMEQPYAIEGARRRVAERLIPGFRGVRVEGASLGNMAGLYGAARLAEQLLEPGEENEE